MAKHSWIFICFVCFIMVITDRNQVTSTPDSGMECNKANKTDKNPRMFGHFGH
jgi:hypothetical protein